MPLLMKFVTRVEDAFLHPDLRRRPDVWRRARLMAWCCLISGPLLLGVIIVDGAVNPESWRTNLVVGVGHSLTCSTVFLLRRSASLRIPALLITTTATLQLLSAAWQTGGIHSQVLMVLPLATVFFGLLGSWRVSAAAALALVSGVAGFFLLDLYGVPSTGKPVDMVVTLQLTLWSLWTAVGIAGFTQSQTAALVADIQRELEARKALQLEAERAREAREFFIAYLSHEIRNPLATMQAWCDLLSMKSDSDDVRRFVASISETNEGMAHLLDEVLELSSLEADAVALNTASVEVATWLDKWIEPYHEMMSNVGQQLAWSAPPGLTAVADQGRLEQVMRNLLGNALKYAGPVAVRVDASLQGDRVAIQVSDEGRGISVEEQASLFEPFTRGLSGAAKGTGLGLAISRHLVEKMGGELTLTSELGRGASFWLMVPAAAVLSDDARARAEQSATELTIAQAADDAQGPASR